MKRRSAALALCLSAALAPLFVSACSTLGGAPAEPVTLPHNGTGPYRELDVLETNVMPAGQAIALPSESVDNAMIAPDRSLFYASAIFNAVMPVDAGMPADAGPPGPDAGPTGPATTLGPNWLNHMPRRISRSAGRSGNMGFDVGTVVLEATQAWEGSYVTDPWVVQGPSGDWRLYYATEAGIGVATAASPEGPFTHGSAPILASAGTSIPRRPSVVATRGLEGASHPFLLFFERDGRIETAGSADGLSFTPIGPLTLAPMRARDDRDGEEESVGGPGAVVVTTITGRSFLRLYYESRRSNGSTLLTLAASPNGATFEDFGRPVVNTLGRRFAAPFELDERISLLVQWSPPPRGARNQGVLVIGIAPAGARLAPEAMMMPGM
jgi:hypothetical protein